MNQELQMQDYDPCHDRNKISGSEDCLAYKHHYRLTFPNLHSALSSLVVYYRNVGDTTSDHGPCMPQLTRFRYVIQHTWLS